MSVTQSSVLMSVTVFFSMLKVWFKYSCNWKENFLLLSILFKGYKSTKLPPFSVKYIILDTFSSNLEWIHVFWGITTYISIQLINYFILCIWSTKPLVLIHLCSYTDAWSSTRSHYFNFKHDKHRMEYIPLQCAHMKNICAMINHFSFTFTLTKQTRSVKLPFPNDQIRSYWIIDFWPVA